MINLQSKEDRVHSCSEKPFSYYKCIIPDYFKYVPMHWHEEFEINCDLTVIEMKDYKRTDYFDETGCKWVAPSPNLPTVTSAIAYNATCIFEGTNIAEGRGTTQPFEIVGA